MVGIGHAVTLSESIARMTNSPNAGQLAAALRQISDRIPSLRQQGTRSSEQDTKRVLITPALQALGWDIFDVDEVRNEYRHNAGHNPVDYALFLNRSPVLFVEAKPLAQSLDDPRWILQTLSYAHGAGVEWCVLTNGGNWRIYKVLAQGEAEQKLFTAVSIDKPGAMDDVARVLSLLSRDNMRARAIDDIWQSWHVDRQVKNALEQVLRDDAFASLVRRQVPQLSMADVRKSLRRADIAVSYPNVFDELLTTPDTGSSAVGPASALAAQQVSPGPDSSSTSKRPRLQSTQDLFNMGRIKAGDVLTIRNRENSAARIIDGRTVEFNGEILSFNDWGQRVTGWPSIRIYTMALLPDGRSLDQLRDVTDPEKPSL